MGDQLKAVGQLDQLAQIHNTDAVGDMLDNAQVMRDKEVGQPHLLLQILKHIDDLRLNRDIQRGDRLIADDELRVHSQRTGDADTLTLTARELVRVAVGMLTVQADTLQQGDDLVVALLGVGAQVVDVDALAHDVANRHAGVFLVKQHLSVIDDGAVRWLIQTQQGAAGGGLAAAGLADQTQGLALADGKAYIIDSLHILLVLAHAAGREILLQVLYLDQILLLTHSALPPFSNSSFWRSQQ